MNFSTMYAPRRRKIGLTALIDVVFIMLMFFMLTSSFEQWKTIEIDAPISDVQSATPNLPQFIVLTSSGLLYPLHEESIAVPYSEFTLNSWSDMDTQRPILLLPEPEVKLQQIVSVIEQLLKIGLAEVSLGDLYHQENALETKE